jgi:hypothetical protein
MDKKPAFSKIIGSLFRAQKNPLKVTNDSILLFFLACSCISAILFFLIIFFKSLNGQDDLELGSQIGDMVNGVTAPLIGLLSVFLIYKTLKAQNVVNLRIQEQIDHDAEEKSLNQLYAFLDDNINNFRFRTLPVDDLANIEDMDTEAESLGGEAFYKLFNQIRCHYHGTESDLDKNQSISELWSILNVMDNILERLENTNVKSKATFRSLVEHLFLYKMTTRIKDATCGELERQFCDSCGVDHGIPDKIREILRKIRIRLGLENIDVEVTPIEKKRRRPEKEVVYVTGKVLTRNARP